MKTKLCMLFIMLLSAITIAQNGINYKAIIKDGGGNVIANDLIIVQFTIIKTSAAGATVYQESHSPVTDSNGVIIVNIGEGTPLSGVFTDVAWANDKHFLNVQINTGSGLVDLGTTEFKTVPYALNVTGLEKISEGGNTGWRLIGQDPAGYADIGNNAVDLSTKSVMPNIGASGANSFAAGQDNYATSQNSAAFGFENVASGGASFVGGFDSSSTGAESFAFGNDANASGNTSVAFGSETSASGILSFVMGVGSIADGNYSTAFGDSSEAIGENSFSIIGGNAIGANSFAKGGNAIGVGSVALNPTINVSSSGGVGLGVYNLDNTNAAFMVGTGTGEGNRKNAFTVDKFERVGIGTNNPAAKLHLKQNGADISNGFRIETSSNTGEDWYLYMNADDNLNFRNDAVETLTIEKNTGDVGIGTTNPTSKLHVNGTGRFSSTLNVDGSLWVGSWGNFSSDRINTVSRLSSSTNFTPSAEFSYTLGLSNRRWLAIFSHSGTINTSDRRDKTNIATLDYGLNEVMQLEPVSFQWKSMKYQGSKLGLIAQDLLEVIPEVVHTHDWVNESEEGNQKKRVESERMGVYYSDLIPVLIKAIQEQQEIITVQKVSIQNQEELNSKHTSEIGNLKNELEALLERIEIIEATNK